MNIELDTKLSFFSGTALTIIMTGPLVQLGMALALGVIGGFGGVLGKHLFFLLIGKKQK